MPQKKLTDKPTSNSDYAFTDFAQLSRKEFLEVYPLGVDSAIESIVSTLIGLIPNVSWILATYDPMDKFTSKKKKQMINEIYEAFVEFPGYKYVFISVEYVGYTKGSQGVFWMPGTEYRIHYSS